ncbi:hypothetical protein FRB95_010492 [Tulasnella sp. JGI-2019a]|nr:hypothetical protein FRB95_010492 [Tulasnella sp. JGI-2019a]
MLAKYLDEDNVFTLVLTCRTLQAVLEPCLYKHIIILVHQHGRIRHLLQMLCARSDLARSTISFNGYLSPEFYDNSFEIRAHGIFGPYWVVLDRWKRRKATTKVGEFRTLLLTALDNMENLRSLNLLGLDRNAWPGSLQLLEEASGHISLTSLHVGSANTFPTFPTEGRTVHSDRLMSFIRQQPLLEQLNLPKGSHSLKAQTILPTDMPILRSLSAMTGDATLIVPGRPITSVTLFQGLKHETKDDLWKAMGASSGPLAHITLKWTLWSGFAMDCQFIATHLPQLESLTLESLWEGEDFKRVTASLRLLGRLRNLHIDLLYSSMPVPEEHPWDDLPLACPEIEHVSITRSRFASYYFKFGS